MGFAARGASEPKSDSDPWSPCSRGRGLRDLSGAMNQFPIFTAAGDTGMCICQNAPSSSITCPFFTAGNHTSTKGGAK